MRYIFGRQETVGSSFSNSPELELETCSAVKRVHCSLRGSEFSSQRQLATPHRRIWSLSVPTVMYIPTTDTHTPVSTPSNTPVYPQQFSCVPPAILLCTHAYTPVSTPSYTPVSTLTYTPASTPMSLLVHQVRLPSYPCFALSSGPFLG